MSIASRVEYRERQPLRAGDLQAEQDYLLGLDGRHNLGPHGWGIVCGLHVSSRDNKAVVSRGLAIDGYGRELVVRENVERPLLQNVANQFVYLVYCERPHGGCGDTNSRWRDSAEIIIREKPLPIPTGETDLQMARVAGPVTGAPWPVLLAFINVDHTVITEDVYFTRVLAAHVASPSGRALMRIGQENLADLYHFRVSVRDDKGRLRNRLAIDRDGNSSIWGNLIVQGTTYETSFRVSNHQFKIESNSGALLWRAVPELVGNERAIKVTFRKKDETETINQKFKIDNVRSIRTALSNFSRRDYPVKLSGQRLAEISREEEKEVAINVEQLRKPKVIDDREQPLERAGGILKFDLEEKQGEPVRCGCREDADNEARLPEGLIFRPATVAPANPTSRDIYSIEVKEGDETVEQVRISGGLFAEGDFSKHVTFIGPKSSQPSQPALSLNGNGSLYLTGGQVDEEGLAFDMIKVTGTTAYPLVKPDPRDPLFNYLIIWAFIQGLMSLSQSLLKITFAREPQIIEIGKPWEYELALTNLSTTSPLKMQTSLEVITTTNSAFNQNFLDLLELKIGETVKKTIHHNPGDVPDEAESAIIDVKVAMHAGNDPIAGSATSKEIPVYHPPSIDEDSIPDSVSVGAPLDFPLLIVNGESEQVTITSIQIDGLGISQSVSPNIPILAPGQQTGTTNVNIPSQTSGAPDLEVQIIVKFTWKEPNVESSIIVSKTIEVTEKH